MSGVSGPADTPGTLAGSLHDAAGRGDLAIARGILAAGRDVNSRDAAGRTPLLIAVLAGQADMIELLLKSGADPNLAAADGTTPLRAAQAAGQTGLAATLRAHGAR